MATFLERWSKNPKNLMKSNVELVHAMAIDFAQTKQTRRTALFLLTAGFAPTVALANVWDEPKRGLARRTVANLRTCTWVDDGAQLVITGDHGAGKTFLAVALAREAALTRQAVRYKVLGQILDPLNEEGGKREHLRRLLVSSKLLVLDHVAEDFVPERAGTFLREVLQARRNLSRATVLVSSRHPEDWAHVFENPDTGHAIAMGVSDALIIELHKPTKPAINLEEKGVARQRKRSRVPRETKNHSGAKRKAPQRAAA